MTQCDRTQLINLEIEQDDVVTGLPWTTDQIKERQRKVAELSQGDPNLVTTINQRDVYVTDTGWEWEQMDAPMIYSTFDQHVMNTYDSIGVAGAGPSGGSRATLRREA